MIRHTVRARAFAAALSALAGYIDAVGFLTLGGFFVSFMSGNSTRLGVAIAEGSPLAGTALALIVAFVAGVFAGFRLSHRGLRNAQARVMVLVGLLLAGAALLDHTGAPLAATLGATAAMGAVNAVFAPTGGFPVGLTYMTGTLVRIGQLLADATRGEDPLAWWPYLMHWMALVAGAVVGAWMQAWIGLTALWAASACALALAAVLAWIARAPPPVRAD
ncbi:MAG TPA: YoaK family protein [Dokdonella sp.]|uniref:YoaK family protein n=1 Tax=Dokdonella sp. TaxID=2291710 RepID=UPI002CC3C27B|nr:YoaK family protein [Dokdonella sp.]HUD40692.1 YoaK family protein [Dokdonella sp.]